jgi:hypothetical protein
MSRSYKKQPVVKDKPLVEYNRKFRRVLRQVKFEEDDDEFPITPKKSRELTNDYDVCDWKSDLRDLRSPSNKDKRDYINK